MILGLLGLCGIPLVIAIVNLLTWCRPIGETSDNLTQRISVLIPVRNEEHNIRECLEQVYASDISPFEVIVYDDNSTDSTSEQLKRLQIEFPSLMVLHGQSLPDGWAGKNHACHQLAQRASGELFVFLDADTRTMSGCLRHVRNIAYSEELPSDMVSVLPKQIMKTFSEQILMPLLHLTFVSWLPLELVRRLPFPSMTAAIGQVLSIKSEAYSQSGGFAAIPDQLVDDMALATLFKKSGLTVRFVDGHHLASCRMYTSFSDIWQGFSKNVFLGLKQNIFLWFFVIALYTTCFVVPFVLLSCLPILDPSMTVWVLLIVGTNYTLRVLLALRYEQSWLSILCHPIASVIAIGIFFNSGLQTLTKGVEWKGRTYGKVKLP